MFSSKNLDRHNSPSISIHVSILLLFFFFLGVRSILLGSFLIVFFGTTSQYCRVTYGSLPLGTTYIDSWSTHFLLIAFTHKRKY